MEKGETPDVEFQFSEFSICMMGLRRASNASNIPLLFKYAVL